jgi:hypothetical protein
MAMYLAVTMALVVALSKTWLMTLALAMSVVLELTLVMMWS